MNQGWEQWADISRNNDADRSRPAVEAQAGYCAETLAVLWAGAEDFFTLIPRGKRGRRGQRRFKQRRREMWRAQHYFYIFLMYIHCYPPEDNMIDTLETTRCKVTRKGFYKDIMPLARQWAIHINHIHWKDRLKYDNHHPFFPFSHTAIWDSTCFRVQRSPHWCLARNVVNGHYDFPSFLVLIAITMTGELVYASGLFRVNSYDCHTYLDTRHLHPQQPFERHVGDGHFRTCPQFDTPCQKDGGRMLVDYELIWNKWLQLVRSRVEHLNTVVKNHKMFSGEPFRGWVRNLALFTKITVHATAVELRSRRDRDGPRYPGYGWWAHS